MDKIKQFLGWMKKKQFWLLTAFIAIASLTAFGLTASGLGAAISQRISAIGTKYSDVQSVSSKMSTHPNSYSHERMKAVLKELEKDVQEAWETQYKHQEAFMTWPAGTFRNEQKARIFEMLRPVEKFVEFPIERLEKPLSSITDTDRGIYRDYVASTFPNIVKIIGTEWKAKTSAIPVRQRSSGAYGSDSMAGGSGYPSGGSSDSSMSGYPGGGYSDSSGMSGMGFGSMMANRDIVIWSQASQQKLMNDILAWYNPKSLPSILDIYYTQEDIWLLSNIMEIIRRTNGNAREHFQAVVKEIEFIRMGKKANRDAGTLTKLQRSSSGASGDFGDPYGSAEGSSMGSSDMYSSDGSSGMDPSEVDPADGRYISFAPDKFFEEREGAEIRASMKAIEADNAVDAVAKRVPIRIRVKMDPSKIHELITQCGNAPFMFEIFQVRINTAPAAEAATGGAGGYGAGAYGGGASSLDSSSESMGYGGDSYGSSSYGSGSYDTGGYGSGSAGPGGPGGMMGRQQQQNIVGVELYGLIYLYNPYDKESLGGAEEEELDEEGTEDGSSTASEAATPLEKLNADLESQGIVSPEARDVEPDVIVPEENIPQDPTTPPENAATDVGPENPQQPQPGFPPGQGQPGQGLPGPPGGQPVDQSAGPNGPMDPNAVPPVSQPRM